MSAVSTFPDYCLGCDSQIDAAGEVYCSQQCRLADLCASPSCNTVSSMTPGTARRSQQGSSNAGARRGTSGSTSSSASSSSSSHHGQSRSAGSAFVLPPAYDFSSHRHSTVSNASTSSMTSMASSQRSSHGVAGARPSSGYFAYAGNNNMLLSSSEAAKKTLSPTSSRSSITSLGDENRNELRAYESGFDVTRDWRRRRASVYDGAWRA